MTTSTREQIIKSKAFKGVLWFMLMSMGGGALITSFFMKVGRSPSSAVVEINGTEITIKHVQQKMDQEMGRISMIRQQYGAMADSILAMLGLDHPDQVALQSLIQETLLNDVADKIGLHVSPDFVRYKLSDPAFVVRELSSVIPFQLLDKDGRIDRRSLQYYLQKNRMNEADFEEQLETALKQIVVNDMVRSTVYVSKSDLKREFEQNFLKRKYIALSLPLDSYIKKEKEKPLSDQELKAFFENENKTKKRYWVSEKRSGTVWYFEPKEYGITISEDDVKKYYDENKQRLYADKPVQVNARHILFSVKDSTEAADAYKKAEEVYAELQKDPKRFADLAKEHSGDTDSAKKGGSLGFVKRGDRDPEFERAMFRLKKDGDISPVIKTKDGFEIVQRVDRKRPTYKSLESVASEIKATLLKKKFSYRFAKDVQRILDITEKAEKEEAFTKFAVSKKAKKESIAAAELSTDPLVQKLFSTKKNRKSIVTHDDDKGAVVQTDTIEKSHESLFDTVKSKVKDDLYAQEASKTQQEDLRKMKVALSESSVEAVKNEFQARVHDYGWLKSTSHDALQKLKEKDLPVSDIFSISQVDGSIIETVGQNGFVIKLEAIEPFDQVLFDSEKGDLRQELAREQEEYISRGFVASLYRHATIKKHELTESAQPEIPEF